MRNLLVIFLVFASFSSKAQVDSVRFYSLDELKSANADSVVAISLRKQKLDSLPELLFQFTHIKYLDLGKNNLNNLNGLNQFSDLVYLNIEKNRLFYFPIAVCSMPELEELVLNRNEFTNVPSCIENCSKLRRVDLWATPVTDFAEQLSKVKSLEELDLSSIKMSPTFQNKLETLFPNVKLIIDAPCDCME